jgi:hypothetical protein
MFEMEKFSNFGGGVVCAIRTSLLLKSINFWDITPCSPLSVNRRFGGTFRLHIQGRRNKFSKKPASKQVACHLHNHRCENLKSYTVYFFLEYTTTFYGAPFMEKNMGQTDGRSARPFRKSTLRFQQQLSLSLLVTYM